MEHLFVYGVLIRELAQGRAAELIAPLGPGTRASVRGALYALQQDGGGWYPILLPDPAGGEVHGVVHPARGVDWPAMDDFEDAHGGPDAEYARRVLPVAGAGIPAGEAFVYCFARILPADAEPIAHGDFAKWLSETGRKAIEGR